MADPRAESQCRSDALRDGALGPAVHSSVQKARVLVVGAGGIGCELLKNMAMMGFGEIELIDLDTIDVTNLNRQFLFQKKHVGQSKAKVAGLAVERMNPAIKVTAIHGNIMDDERDAEYFGSFDIVLNALDNVQARNHVNRMCIVAKVPLIESGTEGYLGQVQPILATAGYECYECQPKAPPKSYPVCTVRNTPSLPIHCIVWAKFLFANLFGKPDDENDVTPDTKDPELDSAPSAGASSPSASVSSARITLRDFAKSTEYDPKLVFDRIFVRDIETLLSMKELWEKKGRVPPIPVIADTLDAIDISAAAAETAVVAIESQRIWTLAECRDTFSRTVVALSGRLAKEGELDWDKDDEEAMDFVTATANLRSHAFHIPRLSPFDTKSMAGKIIPAIATTNAVIAAGIVLEAIKVLDKRTDDCRTVYFTRQQGSRGRVLNPVKLQRPNKACAVCQGSTLFLQLDTTNCTIDFFEEYILKKRLGMKGPDVFFGTNQIVSSDPDDADMKAKVGPDSFAVRGIRTGSVLLCEDFFQKFTFKIQVQHAVMPDADIPFVVTGEPPAVVADDVPVVATVNAGEASKVTVNVDDVDDILLIEEEDVTETVSTSSEFKRGRDTDDILVVTSDSGGADEDSSSKRQRT